MNLHPANTNTLMRQLLPVLAALVVGLGLGIWGGWALSAQQVPAVEVAGEAVEKAPESPRSRPHRRPRRSLYRPAAQGPRPECWERPGETAAEMHFVAASKAPAPKAAEAEVEPLPEGPSDAEMRLAAVWASAAEQQIGEREAQVAFFEGLDPELLSTDEQALCAHFAHNARQAVALRRAIEAAREQGETVEATDLAALQALARERAEAAPAVRAALMSAVGRAVGVEEDEVEGFCTLIEEVLWATEGGRP
ncbi:MAG: hypothetical protein ACI4YA_03760 [Candidatus Spyradenecus sp.]